MLTYNIPNKKEKPIYLYLYEFIKEDILSSKLKPNEKLPSKRALAKQLNISLITIEKAYEQLIIEGYIYAIEKSGYFVEEIEKVNEKESVEINEEIIEEKPKKINSRFPFSSWNSLSRKVLADNNSLYPSPFKGNLELRKAIAKHLLEFHSMEVSYNSIVVGAGSEYLYTLLIQFFGLNKTYALEDPGHLNIAKIYKSNNAKYKYVTLDKNGLNVKELNKSKADIVHISPAHHFPTGISMPLKRRMELLKWASDNDGYIIEDDYDSEYRFSGRPIPPLYRLDNSNRVFYMNTFTKTLAPTFRIAYLVLPKGLEKEFENRLGFYHNTVSSLEQLVLAKFISLGYFERHISRERKYYKVLRIELLKKLEPIIKKYNLKLIEADSGLHFLIEHSFNNKDKEIEDLLRGLNLSVHTLSYYSKSSSNTKKIVVSYSDLKLEEIDEVLVAMDKVLNKLKN